MKRLTSRERLKRCFLQQELDRPAVYVRTGFPADDPTYDDIKRLLREKSDLKAGFSSSELVHWPEEHSSREAYSEDFEREIRRIQTPKGEIISTTLRGLKHQPGMVEKHYLSTPEDIEKYLSLPEPEIGGDVDGFFAADREIGDRGITLCGLPLNPAGWAALMVGSEAFAIMTLTDRDLLHALCAYQQRIQLRLVDYLLARGVGPFFASYGQEYLTPPLHGRKDFFDFNVRYDKPIFDRIHEAGGRMHVHSHGPIRTVVDGFLEMGADVLHPFEPPPMGDITAAEAKARIRGRMCMEGNIQIADMYEKPPEQIRAQTEELIRVVFDDRRGLIVCPSASPYIYGAGERAYPQFQAMVDAVMAYR